MGREHLVGPRVGDERFRVYLPYVRALAVSGSDLYAGGGFELAGGVPAYGIAKWDGSNWSALGQGTGGAGSFCGCVCLGGVGQRSLRGRVLLTHWQAAPTELFRQVEWQRVGQRLDSAKGVEYGDYPYVYALAVSGSDLYVGGSVHNRRRRSGQEYCEMERDQLVEAGSGGPGDYGVNSFVHAWRSVAGNALYVARPVHNGGWYCG